MRRIVYLIEIGIETIAIGFYMILDQMAMRDDPHSPAVHAMHQLNGTNWAAVMVILGSMIVVLTLVGYGSARFMSYVLIFAGALWFLYTVAFFVADLDFGKLKISTILSFGVFVEILTIAWFSDDGRHR